MKVFKVSGKKLLAGIGIMLMLGVTAGCSEVQKFSWDKLKETHYRMIAGKAFYEKMKKAPGAAEGQAAASAPGVKEGNHEAAAALAEGKSTVNSTAKDSTQGKTSNQSKVNVVLYFSDQGGDYLKAEKREIAMVPGLARATVEELIAGPKEKGLLKTIPDGTKLLDINVENGLCRVDLSKEFKDKHWGGSSGEILTVYSLVNTLTQFPSIEKVEILIEGQKVESLAGHMDLSVPVSRNAQIVKGDN